MIELFEKETQELNDEERKIVPGVIAGLSLRTTKDRAITNNGMRQGFSRFGIDISGARMRKIIHYIQVNNLLPGLVSCGSKGYYCSNDRDEQLRYVTSLLARSNSIREVAYAVMDAQGIEMDDIHERNYELLNEYD